MVKGFEDRPRPVGLCLLVVIQYTIVTDGQTDTARRHRPHYAWRRVGKRQLRNIGQFYEKSGGSRGNYHHVWYGKTRMVGLSCRW